MAEPIGDIPILITGDTTQLQKDFDRAVAMAVKAGASLAEAISKASVSTGYQTQQFNAATQAGQQFSATAQQIINSQKQLDAELLSARSALASIKVGYEQGALSANTLARAEDAVRSASENANLALRDISRATKEAADAASKAAADIEASWRRTQQALTTVGIGLTAAITVPIIAGFKEAIQESNKFDLAMRQVTSLMGSVTQAEFKNLAAATLELSKRLGVDAVGAAKGLYEALSAGIPKENAITFLEVASKAAISGVTTTKVAVDGLTTVMNAFHLSTTDTKKAADAMFMAVNLGKFTFEQLAAAMHIAIPLGSQVGVSFQEMLAAAATLTKQGVPVAGAMTQIQRAITSLVAPSKEMKALFEQMGVESGKQLLAQKGLAGALQAVRDAAGDVDSVVFKALRRMEGWRAVIGLTGGNLQGAKKDLDAVTNSTGAMELAFQEIEKSGARGFDRLKASMQALAITAGDALAPSVGKIVKNMEPLIQLLIEAVKGFAALDPVMQQAGIVMLGMAAATGPLALMASGFLRLREAILLMTGTTAAIGGLSVAVRSLAAALALPSLAVLAGVVGTQAIRKGIDQGNASQVTAGAGTTELGGVGSGVERDIQDKADMLAALKRVQDQLKATVPDADKLADALSEITKPLKEPPTEILSTIKDIGVAAVASRTSIDDFLTSWERLHAQAIPTAADLDTAMRKIVGDAYDMAAAINAVPPDFGPVTLAEIAAQAKQAGISLDVMMPPDLPAKIKEVTDKSKEMGEMTTAQMQRAKEAARELRQAINTISSGIADAIVHWEGFGKAGIATLESIGKAIIRNVIQQLLEATGLVEQLIAGIGKVLAKIGLESAGGALATKVAGTVGGMAGQDAIAAKIAAEAAGLGGAATKATSGAAGAAAGVGSLANILGIASLGVDIASGIVQGLQNARMESDIAKIEISTRQVKEQLVGGVQPVLNEWLPKLNYLFSIWGEIRQTNAILSTGSFGAGSKPLISQTETDEILKYLKLLTTPLATGGELAPVGADGGMTADAVKKLSRGFDVLAEAGRDLRQVSTDLADWRQWRFPLPTPTGIDPAGLLVTSMQDMARWRSLILSMGIIPEIVSSVTGRIKGSEVSEAERGQQMLARLADLIGGFINAGPVVSEVRGQGLTDSAIYQLLSRFPSGSDFSSAYLGMPSQPGYSGGHRVATNYGGRDFTAAYLAMQQASGGSAVDLGNSSFVNLGGAATGGSTRAGMTADQIATAVQQMAAQLHGMEATRAQQDQAAYLSVLQGQSGRIRLGLQALSPESLKVLSDALAMNPNDQAFRDYALKAFSDYGYKSAQAGGDRDAGRAQLPFSAMDVERWKAFREKSNSQQSAIEQIQRLFHSGRLFQEPNLYSASPINYSGMLSAYQLNLQNQQVGGTPYQLPNLPGGNSGSGQVTVYNMDLGSTRLTNSLTEGLWANGFRMR